MESQKIKIAYLVNYFHPAGLENFILNLINTVNRNGFQPYLYIIYWSQDDFVKEVEADIPIYQFNRGADSDITFFKQIVKRVKKDGIKIVQSHNWGTFLEAALLKFLCPSLSLIHIQQGLEYHSTLEASLFKRTVRKLLRIALIRFFNKVIAVSYDAKAYLEREWVANNVEVIYNSIDTEIFSGNYHNNWHGNEKSFKICTVGRVVPVKNYLCLLKAVRILKNKIPDLKLYHIGDVPLYMQDGSNSEKNIIEEFEYVRRNKLEKQVEFLGIRNDIHVILSGCDIFALTSLSEGLSFSIVEAQASGLPAVVTDVGGNPEIIQNNINGYLVPSDNEKAVAEAILKLYQNPLLRKQMSKNAKKLAREKFDLRVMVRRYEKIYQQLSS